MGMRESMNKSLGNKPDVSTMNDNPLALATDETPFSVMEAGRVYPLLAAGKSVEILPDILEKLHKDEDEAIFAYQEAAEKVRTEFPDMAYIFTVIADEERGHRRIINDMWATVK